MASLCTRVGEWLRSPFSAVVTFQKQFVDDVAERVRHEKERLDRKTRELQQRATQLHLDKLEEKYLCCVCGKPGESREDDDYVYDTFALVTLPPSATLTQAMARAEAARSARYAAAATTNTTKLSATLRRASSHAAGQPASDEDGADDEQAAMTAASTTASTSQKQQQLSQQEHTTVVVNDAAHAPATAAAADPARVTDEAVQELMYKVRHAVLNKEARTRRRSVAVHKDKGLMMIDDADVDLFSCFFQRPVHGYLCVQCYTSVRTRLDLLTRQIQTILYKGKHPLLRKLPADEQRRLLQGSAGGSGRPDDVAAAVPSLLMRDVHMPETFRNAPDVVDGSDKSKAAAEDKDAKQQQQQQERPCDGDDRDSGDTAVLRDVYILDLRAHTRCDVCRRHLCSFFVRRSVLFLCAFCCARDRYYRDHAVCINDEPMPSECAHLLSSLCAAAMQRRHERQQQQQHDAADSTAAAATGGAARTSLFRHANMATIATAPSAASSSSTAMHTQQDSVVLLGGNNVATSTSTTRLLMTTADTDSHTAPPSTHDRRADDRAVDLFALLQPLPQQTQVRVRPAAADAADTVMCADATARARAAAAAAAVASSSSVSLFANTQLERVPAVDLFAVNSADAPTRQ